MTDSATGRRVFDTIDEALRVQHIPFENYAVIHRIVQNVPVERFLESSGGIRAVRRDGGKDLIIHSGYTTGFETEADALAASGGPVWKNSKTGVNWLVEHPLNSMHDGGGSRSTADRPEPKCPTCGNVVPSSGLCDFCD